MTSRRRTVLASAPVRRSRTCATLIARGKAGKRLGVWIVEDRQKKEQKDWLGTRGAKLVGRNGVDGKEFPIAVDMWVALLNDMEKALSMHKWLAADVYTITDAAFTPYLTRLDHLNVLGFIKDKPRITAWYEAVKDRASYRLGITDWLDENYLELMMEKGNEAWPKIARMIT